MRPIILVVLIAAALFAALSRPLSPSDRAADLPPITLHASSDSGLRGPGWDLRVTADRSADLTVRGFSGRKEMRFPITPAQFAALDAALNENHFYALASDYGSDYSNGDEATLMIRRGDDVKTVVLHNLQNADASDPGLSGDTQQAMAVWELVRDWTNDDARP